MRPDGRWLAGQVILGIVLAQTVAPADPRTAGAVTAALAAATFGTARAAPLVPVGLGWFRALAAGDEWERRRVPGPQRAVGVLEVVGDRGAHKIVRAGSRRLLVRDSTSTFPAPGYSVAGTLRLDPIRSRAERSAFDAIAWARSLEIHGRGVPLGELGPPRPAPGGVARARRAASKWREFARERLGDGPGRDLLRALVLGDRAGLEDDDRNAFRRAGLAHVLALSGMHVGVLALGLAAILRGIRLPPLTGLITVIAFLGSFAFLVGGSAPILRAGLTSGLALLAFRLGRRPRAGHAIGLVAAGLLLLRPAWLWDAGFRLSFTAAAVLGLLAASPPWFRGRTPQGRWTAGAVEALRISSIVTLATAPEILASFGEWSVLSPVTNLLATLPATAALGWGALGALVPLPDAAGERLVSAGARSAQLLAMLAERAAPWPGSRVILPAPPLAVGALAMLIVVGLARGRRPPARAMLFLAPLAAAALLPRDRITVLDIGQGDAVLLESQGRTMLVDAGRPGFEGRSPDAPPAVTTRVLGLDHLLLTHGHADHTGGAADLLAWGRVRTLWMRDPPRDDGLRRHAALAESLGVPVRSPGAAAVAALGGAARIAAAWEGEPPPEISENDRSLVVRYEAGPLAMLMLGDGGHPTERTLLRRTGSDLAAPVPVLLTPHHGSRDSASPELLDAVRPRLVLISCGQGNPHGHPHAEMLARVRGRGGAVLRTDRDGTVALTRTFDGFRIRWTRDFPGPRRARSAIPLPSPGSIS